MRLWKKMYSRLQQAAIINWSTTWTSKHYKTSWTIRGKLGEITPSIFTHFWKILPTLHYRINVALFLLIFAEISCATFISHAQLLFIFENFECATFIRLRYICIAAWCFINNRCFKANLKHLMSCHVFLLSILCMLD